MASCREVEEARLWEDFSGKDHCQGVASGARQEAGSGG